MSEELVHDEGLQYCVDSDYPVHVTACAYVVLPLVDVTTSRSIV